MNTDLIDNEPSVTDYRRSVANYDAAGDRELTLSTPAILGIFFALAIVCACFFGLGYAMGRKSIPTGAPAVFDSATAPGTSAAKPAAGQPNLPPDAALTPDAPSSSSTASSGQTSAQTVALPLGASPAPAPASPSPAQTGIPAASAASAPAAGFPPGFIVQVAAVSSQDVAGILVTSLEKKGYIVAVRPSPQDNLLHVQIGPFADRAAAEATRQRVLADGFNAIVK